MTPHTIEPGFTPALLTSALNLHSDLINLINVYANDHAASALAIHFETLMRTADAIADILYPQDPQPHYC